jgi:short-subunit dehydrogenase
MPIEGSRVLLAGATGGFGGELARSFAQRGARLVLSGAQQGRTRHAGR